MPKKYTRNFFFEKIDVCCRLMPKYRFFEESLRIGQTQENRLFLVVLMFSGVQRTKLQRETVRKIAFTRSLGFRKTENEISGSI